MVIKHWPEDDRWMLVEGDCVEALRQLPDNCLDSIVTDPPYGLSNTRPDQVAETITRWVSGDREFVPHKRGGFMGKEWDSFVPPPAVWDECLRILKPGGHLLTFAGTRTMDLMTLGLRLAGFDIRDSIAWLYGSGFPKSHDVSKAIDKAAGAEREVVGRSTLGAGVPGRGETVAVSGGDWAAEYDVTAPSTDEAKRWQGWGTALKPAFEPVVVARKPYKGTVAANVLQHGTGALNIDGCRVEGGELTSGGSPRGGRSALHMNADRGITEARERSEPHAAGRWPANVVLDESQAAALDEQSGERGGGFGTRGGGGSGDWNPTNRVESVGQSIRGDGREVGYGDSGGASRFFYSAKASKRERPVITKPDGTRVAHPTVKPVNLMRWLVRLVTPPGGVVLDSFAGSGATIQAAVEEGFEVIGIEREPDYIDLVKVRMRGVA